MINTMSYDEKLLVLRGELIPAPQELIGPLFFVIIILGFLLIVINNKKYSHWKKFMKKFF